MESEQTLQPSGHSRYCRQISCLTDFFSPICWMVTGGDGWFTQQTEKQIEFELSC